MLFQHLANKWNADNPSFASKLQTSNPTCPCDSTRDLLEHSTTCTSHTLYGQSMSIHVVPDVETRKRGAVDSFWMFLGNCWEPRAVLESAKTNYIIQIHLQTPGKPSSHFLGSLLHAYSAVHVGFATMTRRKKLRRDSRKQSTRLYSNDQTIWVFSVPA